MQRAWITLGPMLAAAALVLWGGERLARRTVEDRLPADRVRLFDFTASLRAELDRLSELYEGHLDSLATRTLSYVSEKSLIRSSENLIGVRNVYRFAGGKKDQEFAGTRPPVGTGLRVPPVELDDGDRTLHPGNAVVLPREVIDGAQPASGWIAAKDGNHRVYWRRTSPQYLCAVVIDNQELQSHLQKHLRHWIGPSFAPLTESGQLVSVQGPGEREIGPPRDVSASGPAALVLPHRNLLGEWQVLAWDRLKVRQEHDPATLTVAAGIACSLLLAGIFLQIQQGRALKLAEERVSFVNQVSHELGTPLTNILLNLELAGRGLESRPAETRKRLKLVDEEVRRLARLVANVLTFSRGERKTLELRPRPCVPDEIVTDVLHQFEPSLERAGLKVERHGEAPTHLQIDPDALFQIVANLISNVEKYAASGGWIGIDSRIGDGRLRIRVSDAGPGIPAGERKRVFEAFERVSSRLDEGVSGTGLGLAIARDLAQRMGGTLSLLPAERGCSFELELPAAAHLSLLTPDESAA